MFLDRQLSIADKFRKSGDLDDAILVYDKILSKFPLNKRAQLGKLSCVKNQNDDQAFHVVILTDCSEGVILTDCSEGVILISSAGREMFPR